MNLKVSIIIPVYNVEKYIAKCIQSLLAQTYKNFEAIIVDDGSPDNSIQIAKELVNGDPRFVFLEKENGGLSSARNLGLDYMKGDYVAFLDSDDYFHHECLDKVITEFEKNRKIDIVIFGTLWVSEKGEVLHKTTSDIAKYCVYKDILLYENSIEQMVWNKVYHRDVFVDERFYEGIIYEDTEIIPRLLLNKKLSHLPYYLYRYIQREGSITNEYNRLSISSIFFILNSHREFLEKLGLYNEYKMYYEIGYIYRTFYHELKKIVSYSQHYDQDIRLFKKSLDEKIISWNNILRAHGVFSKSFLLVLLFKIHPKLILAIDKFKRLLGR